MDKYKPDIKNVFTNICSWTGKVKLEKKFTNKIMHFDWKRKFWNKAIENWCSIKKTEFEPIIEYSSESNSITEQCNYLILDKANIL